MPIAIDGKRYENDFEYTLDPIAPDEKYDDQPTRQTRVRQDEATLGNPIEGMRSTLKDQDIGGGTGANAFNQPLADYKLPQEMDQYITKRGAQDISMQAPITEPDNQPSEPLRITVTPKRPIEDKPMDEPFVDHQERRTVIDKLLGLTGDRYQTWPERAARSILQSANALASGVEFPTKDFPSDAPVTEEQSEKEHKNIGHALETVGAMVFGPAPIAAKAVDGTLGSIAGVSAKTADMEALKNAKIWERYGYPADQIFEHSGWFRGFDKQWKHELPTENALYAGTTSSLGHGEKYELGDLLHFPELVKAYPELDKLPLRINTKMKDAGAYLPSKNEIVLNPKIHENDDQILDTLLHEVQHWIQRKEGFDFGTNPKTASEDLIKALKKKLDYAKSPEDIARLNHLIAANKQFAKAIGEEIYVGNPGEREARMVELRRTLTAEQRRQAAPTSHQSYLDKQIPESYEVRLPWEKPPMTLE